MGYLFIAIIFGFLPSIIWLLFYLRKDVHPESNWMILKVFFWGMLITLPVALLELGIGGTLKELVWRGPQINKFLEILAYELLGIALIEETLKYLVVKWKVLNHPEFDEPVDVMLYMIIVALGFAALENILFILPSILSYKFLEAASISGFRFILAILLHTLCSGTLGYFLAISLLETKKRAKLITIGLGLAIFLHGLYNFFIINISKSITMEKGEMLLTINNFPLFISSVVSIIVILAGFTIFISLGFQKLKNMKSVCKIK